MSFQSLPTQAPVAAPVAANDGQPAEQGTTHQHLRTVLLDLINMGHDIARTVHAVRRTPRDIATLIARANAAPGAMSHTEATAPPLPPKTGTPLPDAEDLNDMLALCAALAPDG